MVVVDDTYEFLNQVTGSVQIVDAAAATADTSQDALDFSAYASARYRLTSP